jgi:hypothetical protein
MRQVEKHIVCNQSADPTPHRLTDYFECPKLDDELR